MDLDKLTALAGTKARFEAMAPLIGTKFRNQRLLTKTELLGALDTRQRQLAEWLYAARPAQFGLKTPFYGIEEPTDPTQFVKVQRTLLSIKNEPVPDTQYVHKPTYDAFRAMAQNLTADIKGHIEISSAYRSPAFQVLLICYNAKRHSFDLSKTLSLVALPGYSEHGLIESGAIDLQIGHEPHVHEKAAENLAKSKEYQWLVKNAAWFGFRLSYPPDNKLGMAFEPWHWRYFGG